MARGERRQWRMIWMKRLASTVTVDHARSSLRARLKTIGATSFAGGTRMGGRMMRVAAQRNHQRRTPMHVDSMRSPAWLAVVVRFSLLDVRIFRSVCFVLLLVYRSPHCECVSDAADRFCCARCRCDHRHSNRPSANCHRSSELNKKRQRWGESGGGRVWVHHSACSDVRRMDLNRSHYRC